MMEMSISGNQAKYMTNNPLKRYLINRFMRVTMNLLEMSAARTVLDAGCGEGYTIELISRAFDYDITGVDINLEALEYAESMFRNNDSIKLTASNIYEMPFNDNSFDIVICNEVLEHLEEPTCALDEIQRVSKGKAIISVPHEPYFTLSNFLALNHLKSFGNAPGHINHFNIKRIKKLIDTYMKDYKLYFSFPWIVVYGSFRGK